MSFGVTMNLMKSLALHLLTYIGTIIWFMSLQFHYNSISMRTEVFVGFDLLWSSTRHVIYHSTVNSVYATQVISITFESHESRY